MMVKSSVAFLCAFSLFAALGDAHSPAGAPRNYCEDASDFGSHDYGPPATGFVIALGQDGNILGDCNGDTVPADYDGHAEFAVGGGWLSAESGDGVTSGSVVCFGEDGHHPFFGPIAVVDAVVSTPGFTVGADAVNLVPPADGSPDCGDFESDWGASCEGSCTVTFPPGLDGTYQVYVGNLGFGGPGGFGHIFAGFGVKGDCSGIDFNCRCPNGATTCVAGSKCNVWIYACIVPSSEDWP